MVAVLLGHNTATQHPKGVIHRPRGPRPIASIHNGSPLLRNSKKKLCDYIYFQDFLFNKEMVFVALQPFVAHFTSPWGMFCATYDCTKYQSYVLCNIFGLASPVVYTRMDSSRTSPVCTAVQCGWQSHFTSGVQLYRYQCHFTNSGVWISMSLPQWCTAV